MTVPRFGLAIVRGRSMVPTLREGDRLVVDHRGRPVAGGLAVVRFADGVVAVKRLQREVAEGWWVGSDAPEGRTSATAGAVRRDDVLAVVRARLWPRPRLLGHRSGPPPV